MSVEWFKMLECSVKECSHRSLTCCGHDAIIFLHWYNKHVHIGLSSLHRFLIPLPSLAPTPKPVLSRALCLHSHSEPHLHNTLIRTKLILGTPSVLQGRCVKLTLLTPCMTLYCLPTRYMHAQRPRGHTQAVNHQAPPSFSLFAC